FFFFFQAEDGIRDKLVTGVQTCALPISRVEAAVREKKPVSAETDGRSADGTIHLSAVDAQGNMVALTLTHGNSFGAMVTVDGLRSEERRVGKECRARWGWEVE